MRIMRMMDDPTRPAPAATSSPPTFVNTSSHWWDASQIYGTDPEYQAFVRTGTGGKLRVEPDGSLPCRPGTTDGNPAQEPGFWVGLAMLQTLFTREHNAVCDMLRGDYPTWTDDEMFQRARLIIAALVAKIHTVEWTPAVISHPTTVTALRANWFGPGRGAAARTRSGGISSSELISGIPGAATEHYGVPYSLTEEFAAVYRMHPLVPDDWSIRAARRRPAARRLHAARPVRARRRGGAAARSRWPTCSTPSAPCTPAWSACTTSRGSCSSSSGPTGS